MVDLGDHRLNVVRLRGRRAGAQIAVPGGFTR